MIRIRHGFIRHAQVLVFINAFRRWIVRLAMTVANRFALIAA